MAAGAWPLLGHLPTFDNGKPTHVTFGALADEMGPVFRAKLGSNNVVIISNQEVAKECYTVHDKVIDRVIVTASKFLGYGSLMTFSPHGPYWKEMRKISISDLFTSSVIDMFKNSRAKECELAFKDLHLRWEQKGKPQEGFLVDMKHEFQDLAGNISLMMTAGKRYYGENPNCEVEEAKKCGKLIQEFFNSFGLFLFSDVIPCLGWLEWKIKNGMKKTAKELDIVVESWVQEHKNKRNYDKDCEKSYIDLLIEIFEKHEIPYPKDAHTTTKAICLNLIFAGSEPVIVVLVWAVSLLANNPNVLRKAQEELDRVIGKERVVEESDLKDLVYIEAIIKETFRLYPPIPLVAYRKVTEDFDISNGQFHVPAGTQLMVNAWKIQRDPNVWPNPEEFKPDRFLTFNKEQDIAWRSNFNLFPFGLGRRSCPAIPLGMRMSHYILARFLHSFDILRPSDQDLDMTESSDFVNLKATPLQILIKPRLPQSLYHV